MPGCPYTHNSKENEATIPGDLESSQSGYPYLDLLERKYPDEVTQLRCKIEKLCSSVADMSGGVIKAKDLLGEIMSQANRYAGRPQMLNEAFFPFNVPFYDGADKWFCIL